MKNRFYMMCLRETVGSNASFHCHNGNGYSSDIRQAHVYTREEAQRRWDYGRTIDLPVSADDIDALAMWHTDHQRLSCDSQITPDCREYVAYVRGTWNGNDVYWLQDIGLPTDDFSKARVFSEARQDDKELVWLPFAVADAIKRPTFNIHQLNRRVMVQGAGLVTPDHIKRATRRQKASTGKVRWNCPCCGRISWQLNPYDFDGCNDVNCEEWRMKL